MIHVKQHVILWEVSLVLESDNKQCICRCQMDAQRNRHFYLCHTYGIPMAYAHDRSFFCLCINTIGDSVKLLQFGGQSQSKSNLFKFNRLCYWHLNSFHRGMYCMWTISYQYNLYFIKSVVVKHVCMLLYCSCLYVLMFVCCFLDSQMLL